MYNVPLTNFTSEENYNHFEQYDLYLAGKAFYNDKKFSECAKESFSYLETLLVIFRLNSVEIFENDHPMEFTLLINGTFFGGSIENV